MTQHSSLVPAGLFTATVPPGTAGPDNLTTLFYGASDNTHLRNPIKHTYLSIATGRLLSWEVTHSIDTMDHFSISLANPDLTLLNHPALQLGAVWQARFGSPGKLAKPALWVITGRQGWTTLTLTGESQDERKLTLKQRPQKWTRKRLSDIARSLFIQAGLVPMVQDSKGRFDAVMRGDETAWQFLKRKADETGLAYAVFARAGKGYFVKQGTDKAPCYFLAAHCTGSLATPSGIAHRSELSEPVTRGRFTPRQASCILIGEPNLQQGLPNQATQETTRGFDPLAKKAFVVSGDSSTCEQTLLAGQPALPHDAGSIASPRRGFGAAAETGRALPTAKTTKTLAQAQVDSRFAAKQLTTDTLTCTVLGDAALMPGEVLLLDCPAAAVAGRWFVRETRHLGQGGAYTTELTLVRNAAEPPNKVPAKAAVKPVPKRAPVNRKPLAPKAKTIKVWVAREGDLVQEYRTVYE